MSVAGTITAGRAAAERLMVDTCRIETVTRSTTPDPTTLTYGRTPSKVYEGRCELKWQNVQARDATPSGQDLTAQSAQLKLPFLAGSAVTTGMRVTILTSADPALIGRQLRLTGRFQQTHATARRFTVEEWT